MRTRGFYIAVLLLTAVSTGAAQPRVDKNVVYGMYSGLALLMDVHWPAAPNGYGVLLVPGSGWQTAQSYDAPDVKDGGSAAFAYLPRLLAAGYTVFVADHRTAPRFRYPAAVEDVQRAVRFIRAHAADYSINADRIGAVGYSSGAHLATLLGVLGGEGAADDPDPVNRLSSRVQSVVANATPTALDQYEPMGPAVISFMGLPPPSPNVPIRDAAASYRSASPVSHASATAAPLLLIHGDADTTVPFHQSELMLAAMQKAGGTVKLIRVPGGAHRFALDTAAHQDWPDFFGEAMGWLDKYLKKASR
jgi:acetyl esterase/lipase